MTSESPVLTPGQRRRLDASSRSCIPRTIQPLSSVGGRDAEVASTLSELAAYGDTAKLPKSIRIITSDRPRSA